MENPAGINPFLDGAANAGFASEEHAVHVKINYHSRSYGI